MTAIYQNSFLIDTQKAYRHIKSFCAENATISCCEDTPLKRFMNQYDYRKGSASEVILKTVWLVNNQ